MPARHHRRPGLRLALATAAAALSLPLRRHSRGLPLAAAFSTAPRGAPPARRAPLPSAAPGRALEKLDEDDDRVVAFLEPGGDRGIDCYVDGRATVGGAEYTIGIPCDYAVALCYFKDDARLIPVEMDEPLMDAVFPVAEGIIEDEFGEELVLVRTPQTLTLVGELEEEEEDAGDGGSAAGEGNDTDEEVEILVSFEEDGREYHLVRLLDPVLLVGKAGDEDSTRILLTPEESDLVMPQLEQMVLSHEEGRGGEER